MSPEDLKRRTREFALRVIRVYATLPKSGPADVIGRQLLRAGTSVGANYRSACKARSPAESAAKMGVVEEEADECVYWMELLIESGAMREGKLGPLRAEAAELVAISAASRKTARSGTKR